MSEMRKEPSSPITGENGIGGFDAAALLSAAGWLDTSDQPPTRRLRTVVDVHLDNIDHLPDVRQRIQAAFEAVKLALPQATKDPQTGKLNPLDDWNREAITRGLDYLHSLPIHPNYAARMVEVFTDLIPTYLWRGRYEWAEDRADEALLMAEQHGTAADLCAIYAMRAHARIMQGKINDGWADEAIASRQSSVNVSEATQQEIIQHIITLYHLSYFHDVAEDGQHAKDLAVNALRLIQDLRLDGRVPHNIQLDLCHRLEEPTKLDIILPNPTQGHTAEQARQRALTRQALRLLYGGSSRRDVGTR